MASYDVASNICPALLAGTSGKKFDSACGGVVHVETRAESAWFGFGA